MRTVVNEEGTFGYVSSGAGAIVKLNLPRAASTGTAGKGAEAPGAVATTPVVKAKSEEVALWGDDNFFPQNVMKDVERNEVLSDTLSWKACAWYGSGVIYGYVELDEQGNEVFIRKQDPEVEAFFRRSNVNRYALEVLTDISFFANAFPEHILSKNR
ncbi:iron-containing alcohol dehydrogenase [Pontibacter mangrovi]|uniref:Iron-containing alcohol dehydrogenase n=1 Tax=Pontibacter mangrovi TaxID=2589816 RepID=A0A501W3X9_9BACT|nr:iron-containing alcohol dehydrogenase [Pontibacter mangrovi]TPE43335.1 iron-containing alcohol dehydrogenase [Pontibacter mangrovi]